MYCAFCGVPVTYEIYICCDSQQICIDCALQNPNFSPKFQCNSCGRELGNRIFLRSQTMASDLQRQMAMSYNRNYVPYGMRTQQMYASCQNNFQQRRPQFANQRQYQVPAKLNRNPNFNQPIQRNYPQFKGNFQNQSYRQMNRNMSPINKYGQKNLNPNNFYGNPQQNFGQGNQSFEPLGRTGNRTSQRRQQAMDIQDIEATPKNQANQFTNIRTSRRQSLNPEKPQRKTLPRGSQYVQMSSYQNQQFQCQGSFDYEKQRQQNIKRGLKMGLDGLLDDEEDEQQRKPSPTFSFNYNKCIGDAHYVSQSRIKEDVAFGRQETRKRLEENNINIRVQSRRSGQLSQGRMGRSSSAINFHRKV